MNTQHKLKTQSLFNYERDNNDNNVYKSNKVNHNNNEADYCGNTIL